MARLTDVPLFKQPSLHQDISAAGLAVFSATLRMMLRSRASLQHLASVTESSVGAHLVTTPVDDPFNEGGGGVDAYGPIMRRELWVEDGMARTTGPGFCTITLTLPAFIRNANITEAQGSMRAVLMMLRFTRADYKWTDYGKYSYYTLEPPADDELGSWDSNGQFIPIE